MIPNRGHECQFPRQKSDFNVLPREGNPKERENRLVHRFLCGEQPSRRRTDLGRSSPQLDQLINFSSIHNDAAEDLLVRSLVKFQIDPNSTKFSCKTDCGYALRILVADTANKAYRPLWNSVEITWNSVGRTANPGKCCARACAPRSELSPAKRRHC